MKTIKKVKDERLIVAGVESSFIESAFTWSGDRDSTCFYDVELTKLAKDIITAGGYNPEEVDYVVVSYALGLIDFHASQANEDSDKFIFSIDVKLKPAVG